MATKEEISSMTIADLRNELEANGLSTSGNKSELVQRIYQLRRGSFVCVCKEGFHKEGENCYPLLLQDEIQVTLHPINSSAILVEWLISVKRDLISSYKILYLPFGPPRTELIESPHYYPVNASSGLLTNLLPDTTYNIRLEVSLTYNITVRSEQFFTATKKIEPIPRKEPRKSSNTDAVIGSIVLTVVIIVMTVLIACYCVKKRRAARREDGENVNTHLQDLIEFRSKDQSCTLPEGTSQNSRQDDRRRNEKSVVLDAWEIPRNQLKIGEQIGEGHFGVVLQGLLTTGENIINVAVKTIKDADRFDMKDFMLEMEMMKEIGYHPNVVSLLGVSSVGAPLYIITEYVDGGNLLDLLRSSRCASTKYENVMSSLNSRDLLNIALDVCKGMRHVASKKLVHRDLAARNVLMTKDLVAKIGDFGLARDIYCEGIYVKTGGGRLPIKWMAPESIKDRQYTVKSDIWSFGILLWEIVTLGGSPYPSMPINILLEKLFYGYRMPKPDHCSDEVYNIMEECWILDPVARPHFDFLCKELMTLLAEEDRTYINVKGLAMEESSDGELSSEQGMFSCNL